MEETLLFDKILKGRLGPFGFWTAFYRTPIRLKVFSDRIIISGPFLKKTIPISNVKQLTWTHLGYIQIEHSAGGFWKFISFRVMGENNPIVKELSLAFKKAGVVWKEIEKL